jgi:glycosyltransferase involved in cell wall biosynthesis
VRDVAAIIPAHNEELSLSGTLKALKRELPAKNIYVADDKSTDRTASIARKAGVHVYSIKQNVGKARALVMTMKRYNLLNRYKAILIHDADVYIGKNYMKEALPLFADKEIAAITPHQQTQLKYYGLSETFFLAYRIRLWRILQVTVRFGQTWKFTNVTYIVPGGLSMYRSSVLKKIHIDKPGLIIEDFNMTFELRKKNLGKAAYKPSIVGTGQDPYYFRDYIKQVKRWNIGFWQTVFRNGIWPSWFWVATGSFMIELIGYAIFLLSVPFMLIYFIISGFEPIQIPFLARQITIWDLLLGVFFFDYLLTIIAGISEKKLPMMLLYGLGFFFLRYVDAFIFLYSIPFAYFVRYTGSWVSPRRRKSL